MSIVHKAKPQISRRVLISGSFVALLVLGTIWFFVHWINTRDVEDYNALEEHLNGLQSSQHTVNESNSKIDNVRKVLDIQNIDNSWQRALALDALLLNVDVEQTKEYLVVAAEIPGAFIRQTIVEQIIRKFAALDPVLALEYAATVPQFRRDDYVSMIFEEWCFFDLTSALAHAKNLDSTTKKTLLRNLIIWQPDLTESEMSVLAEEFKLPNFAANIAQSEYGNGILAYEDPQAKWQQLVNDDQSDYDQLDALIAVSRAWMQQDGGSVIDFIQENMRRGPTRSTLLGELLTTLAQYDSISAFNRAVDLYDPSFRTFMTQLVRNWAITDPEAALSELLKLESPILKEKLVEVAFSTWAESNPLSFQNAAESIPTELKDSYTAEAMNLNIFKDPEQLAKELFGDGRNGTFDQAGAIVSAWSLEDSLSAFQWVLENPNVAPMRSRLAAIALSRLTQDEVDRALELALDQPVGNTDIGYEAQIITLVARQDLTRALSLLTQVRDGETRIVAYKSVGSTLLASGEIESAISIGHALPEDQRRTYFDGVLNDWSLTNPQQAFSVLELSESPLVRSSLAKWLSVYQRFHGDEALSNEQIESLKQHLTEADIREIADEQQNLKVFEFLTE
ncbi:MAG: hypothetical protein F4077_07485 [Gammaproteobacteria bacterium]|nr:hypothetical protein [Gammaproteobacteria bacterium]